MPTTHTWKPANNGYILDAPNYTDGAPFAPGDTLVINGGGPNAQGVGGNVAPLTTGNYQFNTVGASNSLRLTDIQVNAASTLSIVGPQILSWTSTDQFVNDGAIQLGSAAGPGKLLITLFDTSIVGPPATITNTGSITLQNGSRFQTQIILDSNDVFLNAAGAVLSVNSGSVFDSTDKETRLTNNGLIAVNGAAGQSTSFQFEGSYSGAGLLSVRGTPGAAPTDTSAQILYGATSGDFDIASGELSFNKYLDDTTKPLGGTINFLDGNGQLTVRDPKSPGGGTVGATIKGFQAGDRIVLRSYGQETGLTYDPGTHRLTVSLVGAGYSQPSPVQFTLAGNYTQADFQITRQQTGSDLVSSLSSDNIITTTSTANAIPAFSTQDTATGAKASSAGQQYTGPVNYLQSQYIWAGADSVNVATNLPDTFIQGGAGNDALSASSGSNVLDGGFGSNFLTGASGADGGRDTFFLDGSAGTSWDTLANFHPGDSVTLWGFVQGTSTLAWAANEGAAGHTGATIHSAFAGAGAAVNGSVTFAGLSLADAQSKISLTPGSAGGRSYLYAHYNG